MSMGQKGSIDRKVDLDKIRKVDAFSNGEAETHPLLLGRKDPPPDTCFLAYIILYLHGIGHLLPWNFFITAYPYFKDKFSCPQSGNNTTGCYGFSDDFENYFSAFSMLPILLMSGVNIWLQSRVHYKYRMVVALVMMLVLFGVTTAFVGVNTSSWVDPFFAITLLTVILMNIASAIFQSSTFGFAGVLPAKYTSVVMSGQAFAGIFAAIASIVSIAAGGNADHLSKGSVIGYFLVAVVIITLCLLSFPPLLRLKFVQYYISQTSVKTKKAKQEAALRASINARAVDTSPPFLKIFSEIWLYAVSVLLVFTVTLTLFPAVLANIKSVSANPDSSNWTSVYFSPIVCFLLFNVTDFVGRYITHWITIGSQRYVLFILCVLRLAFIPLFMFCNFHPAGGRHFFVLFKSDAYPIFFTTLFGISNGYLGSVAMITAPQQVQPDRRETASTIMAFFLSAGLLVGGVTSFAWTYGL